MEDIVSFFSTNKFQDLRRPLLASKLSSRFSNLWDSNVYDQFAGVLYPFVDQAPLKYWSLEDVGRALQVLTSDPTRSWDAILERQGPLDNGFQNLFHPIGILDSERSLNVDSTGDLVSLSQYFFPAYLRWAEHVFGNFIQVYWSVVKRGGVDGAYDIKRAKAAMENSGHHDLLNGYEDPIRNSIAHGQVTFSGFDIQFGGVNRLVLNTHTFLAHYDKLIRTSNALAIGILLFRLQNPSQKKGTPIGLATRFVAGSINRPGLNIDGAVTSSSILVGEQLHISVTTTMRNRIQILENSVRIALLYISQGIRNFQRIVIQIDNGAISASLCIIRESKLRELVMQSASIERLPEIFDVDPLIWTDESNWRVRLGIWKLALSTVVPLIRNVFSEEFKKAGLPLPASLYVVREIEPIPQAGRVKVWIRAVLLDPSLAEDRTTTNLILQSIAKKARRKFFRSKGELDKGLFFPARPDNIFIQLFKEDGTLRWLKGGGWAAGNLIAVGEYVSTKANAVLVDDPEATIGLLRIRYSMNHEKMEELKHKLLTFFTEALRNRLENPPML